MEAQPFPGHAAVSVLLTGQAGNAMVSAVLIGHAGDSFHVLMPGRQSRQSWSQAAPDSKGDRGGEKLQRASQGGQEAIVGLTLALT